MILQNELPGDLKSFHSFINVATTKSAFVQKPYIASGRGFFTTIMFILIQSHWIAVIKPPTHWRGGEGRKCLTWPFWKCKNKLILTLKNMVQSVFPSWMTPARNTEPK